MLRTGGGGGAQGSAPQWRDEGVRVIVEEGRLVRNHDRVRMVHKAKAVDGARVRENINRVLVVRRALREAASVQRGVAAGRAERPHVARSARARAREGRNTQNKPDAHYGADTRRGGGARGP